jgi:predicted enzyme related to lactoylglutathione lyase
MDPQIKAIYISVKDMDRACSFYEEIFGVKVSSKDKRMSLFNFDNISLLLYNPEADGETVSLGNNIVPNIEVEDIEKMLNIIKSKGCRIVMPLTRIGNLDIFQAEDTEGNIIEFYKTNK